MEKNLSLKTDWKKAKQIFVRSVVAKLSRNMICIKIFLQDT